MATVTTQERTNILKLVAGMFNAAPGAAYLNEFTNAYVDLNKDLGALANALGQTGAFQAMYPSFLTADEFANKFLDTLGLKANTEAQDWVKAKVNAGENFASVAFQALVAIDASTAAEFKAAKDQLANKATVAEHYSVTLQASSNDLAALQNVVAKVTADPKSVEAANQTNEGGNGKTFTLTTGIDNFVGTAGNDTFNAPTVVEGGTAVSTVGGLDKIDGGAGVDTFNIVDTTTTATFALPAGFSGKNIENLNITTNNNIGATGAGNSFVVSGSGAQVEGVTNFTGVAAGGVGSFITAAGTTDVNLTVGSTATATVAGGKAVSVSAGTGAVSVVGNALTEVTVKGGNLNAANSIDNTATGTTLKSVTLDNIAAGAAASIRGSAIETLTLKNQDSAVAVAITDPTTKTLALNLENVGYDSTGTVVPGVTVAAGAAATTLNVNATGAKSNVTVNGATARTLNITGDAALVLATTTAFTKVDGSAATGDLTLGTLNVATANVSTGSGNDSFTLAATAKATVDTGAGNDTVTLTSALAAGSTVNLGAGDDKLLVNGGSVATSTTTAIDAGDGFDTVSASLINAANAGQFKNFEALDVSAALANLDVDLMTGSTIEALTLSGRTGATAITSTVSNVAVGVGLKVSGDNANAAGSSATINVKGAATATDNSFAIAFDGAAVSGAAATAPNVKAGTVVLNEIESLSIDSVGGSNTWNSITLTDNKLKTLTITGDKNLDVAFTGTNGTNGASGGAVSLIDGSAATGKLSINTTSVTADSAAAGLTVKGGSAADTITLAQKATVDAGAGNDTIVSATAGGTFTGGAGDDTFNVASAVAVATPTAANSILATITDFSNGSDKIVMVNTSGTNDVTFVNTKVVLNDTVLDLDAALALAFNNTVVGQINWFNYGTDTYVVQNVDGTTGLDQNDLVVKLTGVLDLSTGAVTAAGEFSLV